MSLKLLEDLNRPQQQAVQHKNGPALVFAGAGSGKTRTLIYRAAYLILTRNVDPKRLLLVTFTNKAAHEMKNRLNQLIAKSSNQATTTPQASTFHSWCAKTLRKESHHLNLPPHYTIYDDQDQVKTIKIVLKKLDLSEKKFHPRAVLSTISEAKNELIGYLEYPQYAHTPWQKTVADIYLLYQKRLNVYHALDFDDLLLQTVQLFKKFPKVVTKYNNQYQHVLVDEYQDTNQAQYVLTRILSKKWNNLFVVGDCSQSIYSWRGADFRNILKLKSDFPNLATYLLEQNYRSKANILQAAYGVINKNTTHPILNLWTEQNKGEKISLISTLNEKKEAEQVVQKIVSILGQQPKLQLSDIAVLYRTNAQSRTIEEAFLRHGLPYALIGGTRFYDRKEIKDCLAYLRLLANPNDGLALERATKIGKRRLQKFQTWAERTNVKETNTVDLMDQFLKETKYLEKYDKKDAQDMARIENIKELRSVAVELPNLHQFLENVALVEQESMPDKKIKSGSKKMAVNLMTLHAAKGLEFKVVFMVGMEEGLFPHSRSLIDKHELEEERRLCYVGITRAKSKLLMTFCQQRLFFGSNMYNTVSRFINDLPTDLVEYEKNE
jgi:DNA helicase-2/ATP-dependent DNA helicase PcrA